MRSHPVLTGLVLLSAAMVGCTSSPDGTVSVYVAAEPGSSMSEIQTNISSVHVRMAGSSAANETEVLESDRFPENWVEVSLAPEEVEASFDAQADRGPLFFGEGAAPVDEYDGVGVLVEGVTGTNENGTSVPVTVADAVTDHRTNFSVDADGETRLVLTFDLNESLARTEGGEWLFTPILNDVGIAHVADDEAGEERHAPGERVNLSSPE